MKRNVLIVMCAGLFVVLLDVTIVNVALPSIAADRHAGLADLQWVVDGYQIALAGLLLTGGTLGNRFRTPAGGAGGRHAERPLSDTGGWCWRARRC